MGRTVIIGGKDRCDYRAMSSKELIEESVYRPSIELCIALGERLEKEDRERSNRCDFCDG